MGRLSAGLVSSVWVLLLFVAVFGVMLNVPVVKASGTIYIRADGSIYPPGSPILSVDNITYTFSDNILDSIVVERDNIVVDGNGHTLQGAGSGTGMDLQARRNVTLGNTEITAFDFGITVHYSSNNTILGNNVTRCNKAGMDFYYSSNNSMSGNNIERNLYGIWFEASSNNTLCGNTFTNDGLGVRWSYGNSMENNTVNGKPLVYLENVSDYSVNNAGQVILTKCDNIRVEGLNLSETDIGVQLLETNNSVISGNNLANNIAGVHLQVSSNNIISGNDISENLVGIWLYGSQNNRIYHNNFRDNTQQTYVDVPTGDTLDNTWDDGYPSGGNYWSDYSGVDLYTGPYQNLTEGIGSDGIGDTNYPINGSNVDNYPLMIPWTNQPLISPLEGQYANYTVLSIIHGSIMNSLHWNLTYHKYVSPFLMYVEIWSSDSSWTDWTWTALDITNRYARHFGWPITGIVADLWFPGLIETDITIGSTVNFLNGTATVVDSEMLHIESRSIECWRLTHDEEIGPSTYIHHTFWFHKTTGLMIGEEVEVGSFQKFNITLAESNILPDYEIVAAYGSTPTIDGTISAHEWSDAASVSFNDTDVFVKQDGTNLYVGFNNSDDQFHDDDTVLIQFDVEHDGGPILQLDDIAMLVYRNGTLLEADVTGGTWALKEVSGWTAVVNSTFDMWQVEFSITYSKVNVVAGVGKIIGVVFARYRGLEGSSPEVFSWPPSYTEIYANPSTWGAMISTGYNWIPEFTSFLILSLFMIASLLAVAIYRKKRFGMR